MQTDSDKPYTQELLPDNFSPREKVFLSLKIKKRFSAVNLLAVFYISFLVVTCYAYVNV